MPNNDMARAIQKLSNIDNSLGALAKVLEAFNQNFVDYAKLIKTDIEKPFEDIRPFDLYDKVRVIYKNTIMHNKVGVVVRTELDGTVEVEFNNGRTGAEYSAHQLEKVVDEPSETVSIHQDGKEVLNLFVADDQGRMLPAEWRHNLGNDIRVMMPDTAMTKLSTNENRPMTRSEFDMYNAELYAIGVIMNEEDVEGTPDERGRLKPYEWRRGLGMPGYNGDSHTFDECRVMTEADFRAYNAKLMGETTVEEAGSNIKAAFDVTKTDAQGKKVPADQPLPEKWRGDF